MNHLIKAGAARIPSLDILRLFAALWVVFGHCGAFPLTEGVDRSNQIGLVIQGIYGNLFAAVPAVIVFFVISGFCIHYPHREGNGFELFPYLARRFARILLPMAAAMVLARPLGVELAIFQNSILWTLVAELIYYSLYPVFRVFRRRFAWPGIIAVSYVCSTLAILVHPAAKDFSPFGNALNWLICLPSWLLGCYLAETNWDEVCLVSRRRLWCARLGIWILSCLCSVLRFHSPLGYPWTLGIFAIGVFFWLRMEIAMVPGGWVARLLERAGQWSYSIYLMHMIANAAYALLPWPNLGFNLNWVQRMVFILCWSFLFYLAIEKPSHLIARWLGNNLRKKVARAGVPGAPPGSSRQGLVP